MKYISLIFIIICFFSKSAVSQRDADIGVYVGGSYYLGDINLSKQFYSIRPAYGGMYRYIFNKRYAVKGSVTRAKLSANDADFAESGFQQTREESFDHNLWEFSVQAEFNFLPYNTTDKKDKFSPYVTAGLSYPILPKNLNFPIAIPFGIGVKYNVDKRVGIGAEWKFTYTFDDDWDFDSRAINDKQVALINNNDWYSFVGLFITYKFDDSFECPAYD